MRMDFLLLIGSHLFARHVLENNFLIFYLLSHINERSECFINRSGRDLNGGVCARQHASVGYFFSIHASSRLQELSARHIHQHLVFYIRKLIITISLY
jgi:hypothetical protein